MDMVNDDGHCASVKGISGMAAALVTVVCAACVAAPPGAAAVRFEDVTAAAGLAGLGGSQAAWGDFNNDGWVDLYVGGQLWRNEGGKRFVRIEKQPLAGPGIWGDYDNDGFMDMYCWAASSRVAHPDARSAILS